MLKSDSVPEQIVKQKIIVYKPHIDQKTVRATAEKMRTQLFRKFMFMKPKPEETQIVSIEKYFEPYVVIDGTYSIEYTKNWTRNIQVEETMQELTIFGGKINPASLKDHLKTPCKIVKITGEGRHKFEATAHLIFDEQWNEVGFEQLPLVPFEEQPETVLKKLDQNLGKDIMTTGKDVELLKSKIVHRPADILSILNEMFTVLERAVIYKPMYNITIQNIKTEKAIMLTIDAITGKIISTIKQTEAPQKKKTANESKAPLLSEKTAVNKEPNPAKKTKSKQAQ